MRLGRAISIRICYVETIVYRRGTHKGKTAVCTPADLRLVDVDKYLGMAQGTPTSITGDSPCVCPSYGLFVDEINCSFRLGLDL